MVHLKNLKVIKNPIGIYKVVSRISSKLPDLCTGALPINYPNNLISFLEEQEVVSGFMGSQKKHIVESL